MTKNRTGNNKFLKKYNETGILDLIRVNGMLSKADLSRITGLSPTAIGIIAAELMEQGYIRERGAGTSSGGRRPVLLELNPLSCYSVGVDIDVGVINTVLTNINGTVISAIKTKMPDIFTAETASSVIWETVDKLKRDFSIKPNNLLGVGISIPGLVDGKTHLILLAPNLKWQNVDLSLLMPRLEGIPIFLENEAMASAIYENWLGSCRGINDFVCINIKSGIGAGIFTSGVPYRGVGGTAGEVGHIVVDENGPKCGCGNNGCLETLASTTAIVEKAGNLMISGNSKQSSGIHDSAMPFGIEHVVSATRTGDAIAAGILKDSACYLGIAVSYIINTLNPAKIILGKDFTKYSDLVIDHVKNIATRKALKFPAARVEIEASQAGEQTSAMGAAMIPLKVLFGK